jgi:hypothetical protein
MQNDLGDFAEAEDRAEAFEAFIASIRKKDGDKPKKMHELTSKELEQALWHPYTGIILDATPEMLNTNATAKAKKYLMRVEKPMIECGWVEDREAGTEGRIKKFVFMIPARFSDTNQAGIPMPRTAYLLGKTNRHCNEVFGLLREVAKEWGVYLSDTIRTNGKYFDMNIVFRTRDTIHALRNPEVRSLITSVEPGDWKIDFSEGSMVLEAQFSQGHLFFKPLGFIDHFVDD